MLKDRAVFSTRSVPRGARRIPLIGRLSTYPSAYGYYSYFFMCLFSELLLCVDGLHIPPLYLPYSRHRRDVSPNTRKEGTCISVLSGMPS